VIEQWIAVARNLALHLPWAVTSSGWVLAFRIGARAWKAICHARLRANPRPHTIDLEETL
jgi:hypothetical protein